MKTFKVLVPTDFSEASLKAIEAATELKARHPDMEITLLHTLEDLPAPADPIVVPPDLLERKKEAASEQLETVAKKYNWAFDVNLHRLIEVGHPWQTICEVAKRQEIDFIVLATHGRTGLSRLLMGSVAEKVVRHATCPVMVVHSYGGQPQS
jgi:universal stress protein A